MLVAQPREEALDLPLGRTPWRHSEFLLLPIGSALLSSLLLNDVHAEVLQHVPLSPLWPSRRCAPLRGPWSSPPTTKDLR